MGFSNGIKIKKPAYTKDTNLYKIENIPTVFIPVGDKYTVTVTKGDHVLVGQLLGIALGHQIPLHCSVSGTVVGIVTIDGQEYIEIENDEKYELCSDIAPCDKRLSQMDAEEMIDRIRLCGISDWKKLNSAKGKAKRFAVNCLDADPYSSDKKCAIAYYPKEIIGGAKIILKILGLRLCEFVIEKNSTDAINTLIDCIGESNFFDIIETKGKYPLGEEQRIISILPDARDIEDDELLVLDVHTVAAVYKAFSQGMPYVRRMISIGGSATYEDGCYDLPLGTPLKYIAVQCAEAADEKPVPYTTIRSGAMRGTVADLSHALVDDKTHALIFERTKDVTVRVGSCIGCGRCDKACPDKLLPSVFVAKHENDFSTALRTSGMEYCSDCGACTYVCPANIPITEVAQGNTDILTPDKKHKKKETVKAPFISHSEKVRTINIDLILALGALLGWAVCRFGMSALILCGISVATACLTELLFNLLTKTSPLGVLDLNGVVCGIMCALTLSPNVPLYVAAITAFFAIIFMKGAFGGHGKNLLHSAFGARVLASLFFHDAFVYDAERKYTLFDHLLGNTEGALGEVSVIILAVAGIYLIARRVISAITPAAIISTFAVITFLTAPEGNAVDTVKIMTIGTAILFVSVFCGAEYSTVPKTAFGKVAYGSLCGAIAAVIGRYTSYEGAYIAALISSAAITPLFTRFYEVEPFGDDADGEEDALPSYFREEEDEEYDNEEECSDTESDKQAQDDTDDETAVFDATAVNTEGSDESDMNLDGMDEVMQRIIAENLVRSDNDPIEASDTEESDTEGDNASADFSDSMEFSIEKADEILKNLSAEIGLIEGSNEEAQAEATVSKGESAKEEVPIDSTAVFNKLLEEVESESGKKQI